ncbi:SDR family oxidoreductase [Neptunitalea lumnitzerae]|uniref:Short-chain dehydrogenase n=1 Tax=Neptunitalea lumnitzerae TaxID=2965509 RepID=A0ABQ5MH99_9FLAO|nr:SDR family oxidoreductase [Neptunitalea sp. Y10]GLB48788.1 short-chain dehydrogenase [Neptunitalea sp. Y10]
MKHVIVTGASRGIGFELVQILANEPCKVLALSRNIEPLKELSCDGIEFLAFDVTEESHYKGLVDYIKNEWAGKVDVLVNNAGLLINKPFSELTKKDFYDVYNVNVFGVSKMIQALIPFMGADGHVVTISSMGGIQGSMKFAGLAAYSSSKGAVITLSELLAEEYKETGPAFNVLALGAVQTEMLQEAFPGYEASVSAYDMASYIKTFALTGAKIYNGKVLQVSNSTP